MEKRDMLYEGKAKKVYRTDDENKYVIEYKDDATAFNGIKKGTIEDKGVINNKMSAVLFKEIEQQEGIPTHLIEYMDERHTLVKAVEIVKLEVIVRNIVAGSLAKRVGMPEGTKLASTVLEFSYKDDDLGDPMINDYHIKALNLASDKELEIIKKYALQINKFLQKRCLDADMILVDYKLEFGRTKDGEIVLADEISPDTCRLWDVNTKEKLDKDRFRRDLGNVEEAYIEVARRLGL
jgi:phosphoribosylaminoimidazole-succinocarboxamide synthase